ncbi:helix-hairpin-helix domain-containing protein [Pedobacter nutrimenti]|uniref:Helix-hairpin-helix protein n=1 Tax=Pedobacter nutrimenti TaxID=1241337 RepID=A0A318UFK6_9SPHI|nr:helix-hairpin-helix domain-containing protein [Pedobacter nutrimenti]PYF72907.1 helix-hairpin-helix protein [Pedobacter nutrimenti]
MLKAILLYRTYVVLIFFYGLPIFNLQAIAQQGKTLADILPVQQLEHLEEDDLADLAERLEAYRKRPLDLNHCSAEELKKLLLLSPLQIANLFRHLQESGPLLALEELQSIDAFEAQTIENLRPFVHLGTYFGRHPIQLKKGLQQGFSSLNIRYAQVLEQQKGFKNLSNNSYLGTAEKILIKYRFNYDQHFQLSLLLKKDAGEELFKGKNKYAFDFMSFSIGLSDVGRVRKLVIGDYSLQFGQGLSLWSGFSFGKGPDVTAPAKKDTGLDTYTSSNEYSFFRGIASTIELYKKLSISPFISYLKKDALLIKEKTGEWGQRNMISNGLHRTVAELEHKNTLGQLVYGTVLQYQDRQFSFGSIAYHSSYEHRFTKGTSLYKAQDFTGKDLNNLGLYYNYAIRNMYFFGEFAKSLPGGFAMLHGLLTSISPRWSAVLVQRYYTADYHSYFSRAFGENPQASNERGWYIGVNYNPNLRWSYAAYADLFYFPSSKYRVNGASSGMEIMGRATYQPKKSIRVRLSIKTRKAQQNTDEKVKIKYLEELSKQNCLAEVDWRSSRKFSFQHRLEFCTYQKGRSARESGFLLSQDVAYSFSSPALVTNLRLAYFHTDSYNSRLYAYEDDVLQSSGFGMYNGKGLRFYLNVRYRFSKKMSFSGRYALFFYPGQTKLGSAMDEIEGPKKSEVKFQFNYQF